MVSRFSLGDGRGWLGCGRRSLLLFLLGSTLIQLLSLRLLHEISNGLDRCHVFLGFAVLFASCSWWHLLVLVLLRMPIQACVAISTIPAQKMHTDSLALRFFGLGPERVQPNLFLFRLRMPELAEALVLAAGPEGAPIGASDAGARTLSCLLILHDSF